MIRIYNKADCCGCSACANICPHGCITMMEGKDGFQYPEVYVETCINCHLCEKVCPVLNRLQEGSVPMQKYEVYACMSAREEVREKSASGGVFFVIAEHFISKGGVVYGVRWDTQYEHACFVRVNRREDLFCLAGSKYVQANVGDTYKRVKVDLQAGVPVLFCGTPCQVSALMRYLMQKKYSNLFLVDVACYGVPSPKIWRLYWKHLCLKYKVEKISSFSMTKTTKTSYYGQRAKTLVVEGSSRKHPLIIKPIYSTLFGQCFLQRLNVRATCLDCPVAKLSSGSDMTLGDFWGVESLHPGLCAEKGVSMVIIKTSKAYELFERIKSGFSVCLPSPMCAKSDNGGIFASKGYLSNEYMNFWSEVENADTPGKMVKLLRKYARDAYSDEKMDVKIFLDSLGMLKPICALINKLRVFAR